MHAISATWGRKPIGLVARAANPFVLPIPRLFFHATPQESWCSTAKHLPNSTGSSLSFPKREGPKNDESTEAASCSLRPHCRACLLSYGMSLVSLWQAGTALSSQPTPKTGHTPHLLLLGLSCALLSSLFFSPYRTLAACVGRCAAHPWITCHFYLTDSWGSWQEWLTSHDHLSYKSARQRCSKRGVLQSAFAALLQTTTGQNTIKKGFARKRGCERCTFLATPRQLSCFF